MGCDIHGVWECRLPNGVWAVFNGINDNRSYEWFGILSGVRRHGPRCDSEPWNPCDHPEDAGEYWLRICEDGDLHSHTLVSIPALRQANVEHHKTLLEWAQQDENPSHDLSSYEPVPDLDEIVRAVWLGADRVRGGDYGFIPRELVLGVPLRDVLGLGPEATIDDAAHLIRMVVAYDS
jgi:hypothetical protein